MRRVPLVVALFAAIAVYGCTGGQAPINTANPATVCIAAAGLQAKVADLQALDPSTNTTEDYRMAVTNLVAQYNTFKSQVRVLTEAQVTELGSAMQTLEVTARDIPSGTTADQAVAMLGDEINAVSTEWQSIGLQLGCSDLFSSPLPSA